MTSLNLLNIIFLKQLTSVIEMALLLPPDGIAKSFTVSIPDFSPEVILVISNWKKLIRLDL